jgi:hypothetical protein
VTRLRAEQPKIRLIPVRTDDFSSSSKRPNRLWDSLSLIFEEYLRLFPRGENGRTVKLTTHFHLMPRLRMSGAILPHYHTAHNVHTNNLIYHDENYPSCFLLFAHRRTGKHKKLKYTFRIYSRIVERGKFKKRVMKGGRYASYPAC